MDDTQARLTLAEQIFNRTQANVVERRHWWERYAAGQLADPALVRDIAGFRQQLSEAVLAQTNWTEVARRLADAYAPTTGTRWSIHRYNKLIGSATTEAEYLASVWWTVDLAQLVQFGMINTLGIGMAQAGELVAWRLESDRVLYEVNRVAKEA